VMTVIPVTTVDWAEVVGGPHPPGGGGWTTPATEGQRNKPMPENKPHSESPHHVESHPSTAVNEFDITDGQISRAETSPGASCGELQITREHGPDATDASQHRSQRYATEWLDTEGIMALPRAATDTGEHARGSWGGDAGRPSRSATISPTDCSKGGPVDLETERTHSTGGASSSQASIWRAILWFTVYYMVAAVVGALPRSIALLVSSTVPHVSTQEATDSFRQLWEPCKEPGAAFPAFSPGAQFYKTLVGSDHILFYLGVVCFAICMSHMAFEPAKQHRVGRLLVWGSCVSQVVVSTAQSILVLTLLHGAPTMTTLKFIDDSRSTHFIVTMVIFAITYVLNLNVVWHWERPDPGASTQRRCAVASRLLSEFGGVLMLFIAFTFAVTLSGFQFILYSLVGFRSLIGIYMPLVVSKGILLLLRKSYHHRLDKFIGQHKILTALAFFVNVTTSTAVRRCPSPRRVPCPDACQPPKGALPRCLPAPPWHAKKEAGGRVREG